MESQESEEAGVRVVVTLGMGRSEREVSGGLPVLYVLSWAVVPVCSCCRNSSSCALMACVLFFICVIFFLQ